MLVGCILYFKIDGFDLVLMECILVCVIGPCAAASSVVTAKLGGSLESMTTYTFVSNVLTAIMIPLFFPLVDQRVEMSFGAAFLMIMWKVCVILVVPMGLAYVVKHLLPKVQQWLTSITDLSFYLLKVMHHRQIVIETLPTSNVVIGHHHSFSTYHLYNWYKWSKEGEKIPAIVVGTDDAGIFATNIYNEYCHIYCMLVFDKGLSPFEAMDYIERLVHNAKVYVFK